MDLYHFSDGQPARRLSPNEPLPADGLLWADFPRDRAQGWECWAEPVVRVAIEPQHVQDSLAVHHPSFFDGTSDYDMLVFEGLGVNDDPLEFDTRSAAFFLFERVLVTVRPPDSVSVGGIVRRVLDGRVRNVGSVISLAHLVLDAMVDRFLKISLPLDRRFTELQDALLESDAQTRDWRVLLQGRKAVRRLESLSERQSEALDAWRRNSCFNWSEHDEVKVRDLVEHVTRVLNHASGQERDIEAAVQLYFAITSGRTNRIMQALTGLSAIFFPLTLITGIYGMNFEHMPELQTRYGYYVVLVLLVVIALSLLYVFRKRRFF